MTLTETEKQHVLSLLESPGWLIFEQYVKKQIELHGELYAPSSVASFFEREQQIGKHELLRTLISDFIQTTK